MNKNRKLWIGVISLLLAGLLFTVLLMIQSSMNKEPVYVEVLRVKNEISRNTKITEENFALYLEEAKVPEEWLPEGYLVDDKQVYKVKNIHAIGAGKLALYRVSGIAKENTYGDAGFIMDEMQYSSEPVLEIPIDTIYPEFQAGVNN
jgi:hypothetical protein